MKNLDSIFAAYILGWGVFFVFYLSVVKRTTSLRAEMDHFKELQNRGK